MSEHYESQRAMIAAKISKKLGENQYVNRVSPIDDTHLTEPQAASLLNVSAKSVQRAKTVQKKGTTEEIKSVEEGHATVTGVAKRISERQKKGNGKTKRHAVHYKRHHAKPNEQIERAISALEGIRSGLESLQIEQLDWTMPDFPIVSFSIPVST